MRGGTGSLRTDPAGPRRLPVTALGAGVLALLSATPPAHAQIAGLPPRVLAAPADDGVVRAGPAWRDRLARLFRDGVLRDEDRRDRGLSRWAPGRVDLSLRGAVGPHIGFVRDLAAELAALTGLAIDVSTDPARVGALDVYVSPDPTYWPRFVRPRDPTDRTFTCVAAPTVVRGVIRRSVVRINGGALPPETVRACLLEEIVQSMGLFGEVAEFPPLGTILDDGVGYLSLGTLDRLLLGTLYDPRLTPGMAAAAAEIPLLAVLDDQLARLACREASAWGGCELP